MQQTNLAGIELSSFCFNASGINNEILKQLEKIASSGSSAILLKSATLEERTGNENPKYIVKSNLIPGSTLNSMGLPNKGIAENLEFIKSLKSSQPKPVIASISGFSTVENIQMLNQICTQNLVNLIEINLSCPNIGHKRLLGYEPEAVDKFLTETDKIETKIPFGIKLPPYLEEFYFDEISEIILKHKVGFITCTNTLGNAIVINSDTESVLIKPNYGRGGLAGDYLKPIALSNVNSFFRRLNGKISIVGVGGIRTGRDAFQYLLAGADCVQIGSGFAQEGISIFEKVNNELAQILKEKGYKSIFEAKGKLKFL